MFVTVLAGLLSVPTGAAASCVAPRLAYEGGDVRAGETVSVVGQYWGDDCYDTGTPQNGEAALGRPLTGIVVMFVQGGTETIVARGDADAGYEFRVDIVIPPTAVLGEARLSARGGGREGDDASREPLSVVSAGDPSPLSIATFGPAGAREPGSGSRPGPPEPATTPARLESPGATTSTGELVGRWWPAFTAAVLLMVGGALLGRHGRRSTRRS